MNVLIDSSTLYSAIAHSGRTAEMVERLLENHSVILSDYIVEELRRNLGKRFSGEEKKEVLNLLEIFAEGCEIKEKEEYASRISRAKNLVSSKDAPVLACGMLPDVDALLTSDKELIEVDVENLRIISPSDAMKELFIN